MKNKEITRRKFLRNSAQGAALAALLPTMLCSRKKPEIGRASGRERV